MARDLIHFQVRRALEKEGWRITADPFSLSIDGVRLEIDLEAQKLIIAEKDDQKIYVEIKTFNRSSILYAFYEAYGQYVFYRDALIDKQINTPIFLAISLKAYKRIQRIPFLIKRVEQHKVNLLVVDTAQETIIEWKK